MRNLKNTRPLVAFVMALVLAGCAHEQRQDIVQPGDTAKSVYDIRLGSWNIKKLGHGSSKDYGAIAGVIEKNFDIMAVIEVMQKESKHPGYDDLMARLGSEWVGQVTDGPRPATSSGNSEFYAIIWRTSAVRACPGWSDLRYHKDNDGGENGAGPDNFVREPAFGCYEFGQAGKPAGDCLLAAYHATFQGDAAINAEVKKLGDVFASMQAARPGEKDLMILGDFNRVPSQIASLLPNFADRASGNGSTLNSGGEVTANLYDHVIIYDAAATGEMQGNAKVLDVRDVAATPAKFYSTVSDHLPIRVELRSSVDDD